ncbi:MAG: hypothetical protein LBG58_16305 [Planctomycetaceae bacterium]|jgi:hypothetical protein|nr:hypothetical protein [Planctomycetaceae bacterium]
MSINLKEMLQKILVPGIFGEINARTAILKENDRSAKLREVQINGVSDDSILIKIDYGQANDQIFCNENGSLKRCDYLLITQLRRKKILLFMEMKSNKVISTEIIQKFRASECLFDYMILVLRQFHDLDFNYNEYKKRFVLFQEKPLPKRPVHPKRTGSAPDNYLSKNYDPNKPPTLESLS